MSLRSDLGPAVGQLVADDGDVGPAGSPASRHRPSAPFSISPRAASSPSCLPTVVWAPWTVRARPPAVKPAGRSRSEARSFSSRVFRLNALSGGAFVRELGSVAALIGGAVRGG